jgi:hypothetical protein
MERDGLTREEAEERIADVREQMCDCDYDPIECEDILAGELGLELDYLFDILL